MPGEASKNRNNDEVFQRIFGAGIGIVALGTVAIISAPVAIPAIGFGLGAIGLGGALSGTAIGFGLVGVSAVVGGVVGGFSPDIYKATSGFFGNNEGVDSVRRKEASVSSSQDDSGVKDDETESPAIPSASNTERSRSYRKPEDIPSPPIGGIKQEDPENPKDQVKPQTTGLQLPKTQPPAGSPVQKVANKPEPEVIHFRYDTWFGGEKLKYKPLEMQSPDLMTKVEEFKKSEKSKNLNSDFIGFNSRKKDLYFFQYSMAEEKINGITVEKVLTDKQIESLKEYYPPETFLPQETNKTFLEKNLKKITHGLKSLNSTSTTQTVHPAIIKDKIVRLNLAIAIIGGQEVKYEPSTYCAGRAFSACFPPQQSTVSP